MPCCCAVGCKNRSDKGFRMFRFPADPNRRKIWLAKIRRDAWKPTTYSRLCEAHFDSNQFENNRLDGRRLLKPFAIPEIFPHLTLKVPRKPPTRRNISSVMDVEEPGTDPVELSSASNVSVECVLGEESFVEDTIKQSNSQDEKDDVIRRLRSQVSALQSKVKKLEACLEETRTALKCFLNPYQLESLGRKSNKGQKWSNETVKNALKIRFSCGIKGYNCITNLGFPLPSDRTLSRRLEDFKFYPGIQNEVFDFLKIKVASMKENERFCVLLLDEMAIEERVEFDRSSKTIFGYTTLPYAETIATHALVFMLAGVSYRWKQTIAYHFTGNSFPSHDVKNLILEIIKMCHDINLNVICVTCDMGSCNRAVWKEFGIICGKYSLTTNSIPHPCRADRKVYFMADVCHLLKNLRNHLLDGKYLYLPDDIVKENCLSSGRVALESVQKIVELQANREVKIVPRLTENHVFVKQYQKMRVRTACDVMSNDVAAGIKYCVGHHGWNNEYLTTAWFFEQVEKWFSLMCSRNPIMALSKHRIDVHMEAINFLKGFVNMIQEIKIGDGRWKPIQSGIKLTTESVLDLQNFLLDEHSFGYVLTSRFCQDSLENLFSTVRVKNPIPSPVQFKNAIKVISIGQFMIIPSRGNYEDDEGSALADFLDVSASNVRHDEGELEETFSSIDGEVVEMDLFHTNSLYYLCGFIVRQLDKKLKCIPCKEIMYGDGKDIAANDVQLLQLKEKKEGSLVRSSKWCWDLAKEAEVIFQSKKNSMSKLKCDIVDYMCKYLLSNDNNYECHNLKELFVKKFFILRIEMFAKSASEAYKNKSNYMGHGSRSIHMRKLVK